MQTIEIQKGVSVGFEEMLHGAAQMGTDDLEKFMDKISFLLARRRTPRLSERELELLKKIYEPFKPRKQRRYDVLIEKLHDETLTNDEHKELLVLTDEAEGHNVEWLEALVELSQIRAVTLPQVMKQLGLDKRKTA